MTDTAPIPEQHPIPPFLPPGATLLMLGTFPPKRERWTMEFFYPNFQNDMWRIFGVVFFGDKEHFLNGDKKSFDPERLRNFLSGKGIAVSDMAAEAVRTRDNASDRFLEITRPADLEALLRQIPACRYLVTTGQKAAETLAEITGTVVPAVGDSSGFDYAGHSLRLYRMPSSSRAYPLPLEKKAAAYAAMFRACGLL